MDTTNPSTGSRQAVTQADLTTAKLLILVAIRHLQPCGRAQLAEFLGYSAGGITFHLCGENGSAGLLERGYITRARRYTAKTIRLSEKGTEAVRDMCLIKEDGHLAVGEVIKRFN